VILATFTGSDGGVLVAVAVLIAISALLALAETSLVRTSKARARSLVEQNARGAQALSRLVEDPESFLHPVLLLVLICQLVAATLVGVVSERLFGALGVAAATVFEVVVIFVAAEAVPKNWAVRHPDRAALLAAPVVAAVIRFPPIRLVSSLLTGISHLVLPDDDGSEQPDITEAELLALADVAVEADVIEREERALLSSIIEFGDTIVREVMAPRPDIVAIEAEASIPEAVARAIEEGKSRLPVFERTVDDIVGIVYLRDLVHAQRDVGESASVGAVLRPAHYVPETKRVAPLLREMQAEQFQLAVVVDEYGGTAGIVTLEDLIEELVGEIADELEISEPLVERLGAEEYRVSGRMSIDEVNELLGANLPEGDWDTIAGLLLHLFGQIPHEGASITIGGRVLVADSVQRRRIRSVRIRPVAAAAPADEELSG
jgi:putative hemolysin